MLVTCQSLEFKDLLRWVAANPKLRAEHISLAYLHLNKELNWELIEEFGPFSFLQFAGISDVQICEILESPQILPLNFFAWPSDQEIPEDSSESQNLFALALGNGDFDDGLLLCHSIAGQPTLERIEPFSFLRLAAEFIYRHHKVALASSDGSTSLDGADKNHSSSNGQEGNPLDGVTLTERQLQILEHISAGLTNEEIAKTMHVSLGTVRVETSRIYDRLGARNRHQAASLAHLLLAK